ncbi:hypothetical protein [Hymenobacter defluvii]|uniref:Lipocalin-like domain-containing protein n=1 Tax=Hymenobacter defluvii TaxID=2054411 RepID=A0ABS3TEZ3_9BACT|nr:hypothetical protein [Hymenobacter defluvii]MBO3272231.1 hypothetical protein [Hymenobacter defluvii]
MRLIICSLSVIVLSGISGMGLTWRISPVRHVLIGKYRYDITLKTSYAHDDDADNTYFMVTRTNSGAKQPCSGFLKSITRQGEIQITGAYAINGPYLLFKKRNHGPRGVVEWGGKQWVIPDSTVTTFSPDHNGQLKSVDHREYINGESRKVVF